MTTHIEITAGHDALTAQKGRVYLEKLVSQFNRFDPESELSTLHKKKNVWQTVSPELWDLLTLSRRAEKDSNGTFRLDFEGLNTTPNGEHGYQLDSEGQKVLLHTDTQLNAGGIAKGYIVDKTVEFLETLTNEPICINAGGDIRVSGQYGWKIGLFSPLDTTIAFGHIKLKKGAVATSGTYARRILEKGKSKSHFFDTTTKSYIETPKYASVTIIGDTATSSELYSKRVLMGETHTLPKRFKAIAVRHSDYKVITL